MGVEILRNHVFADIAQNNEFVGKPDEERTTKVSAPVIFDAFVTRQLFDWDEFR